jgi:mRNA interferase MazF
MQGGIWLTEFGRTVGNEQSGRRPVLIISNDNFNDTIPGLTIVAPMTSRSRGWMSHVKVEPAATGLDRVSWIMTEQIRAVSRRRFMTQIGTASKETVTEVTDLMRKLL